MYKRELDPPVELGRRLKLFGLSRLSGVSSDSLRDCGLVLLGVLLGNSGQRVVLGLIVLVEFESSEYELGRLLEHMSALVGGVISTLTSTDSPARDELCDDEGFVLVRDLFACAFSVIELRMRDSSSLSNQLGKINVS